MRIREDFHLPYGLIGSSINVDYVDELVFSASGCILEKMVIDVSIFHSILLSKCHIVKNLKVVF
jgi:hypothetical protein